MNSPLEDKINAEGFAQPQCRLHSAFTNGHVIKSNGLDNTSLHESEPYRELQLISTKVDSNSPNIQRHQSCESDFMSNYPVKTNGCLCVPKPIMYHHIQPIKYINSENRISLSEYITSSEAIADDKNMQFPQQMASALPCCQVASLPPQTTMSSMNTDTR